MVSDFNINLGVLFTNKLFLISLIALIGMVVYLSKSKGNFISLKKYINLIKNKKKQSDSLTKENKSIEIKINEEKSLEDLMNILEEAEDTKIKNDISFDLTSKYMQKKMNEEFADKYPSVKDSIIIPDEMLNDISNIVKNKLGGLSEFVNRIDKDGKIIIPLDALDFITGKHEPLVMPDGSLRVLNLLTLENEILLSINDEKPIFYVDKEQSIVKKLTPIQIRKITVEKEHIHTIDKLIILDKKNKEILDDNIQLFNRNETLEKEQINLKKHIDNLNSIISSKDNEIKILKGLITNNSISEKDNNSNVDIVNETEKKFIKIDSEKDNKYSLNEEEKNTNSIHDQIDNILEDVEVKRDNKTMSKEETHQLLDDIKKNEINDTKTDMTQKQVDEIEDTLENKKNNVEDQVHKIKIIHKSEDNGVKEDFDENKKMKITQNRLKKIKNIYLNEFELLEDKTFNNSQGKPNMQFFIGKKQAQDKQSHYLFFTYKILVTHFEKFLLKENYEFAKGDLKTYLESLGFNMEHMFFTEANGEVYRGYLAKIRVDDEHLAGQKLSNRFSNGFTLKELEFALKNSSDPERIASLKSTLNRIINKEFKELKDLV